MGFFFPASQELCQSGGFDTSCSDTSLDSVAYHIVREPHGVRFHPGVCKHHECCRKRSTSKSGKKKYNSRIQRRPSRKSSDVEILRPLCEQVLDNAQVATPSASRRESTWTGPTISEISVSIVGRQRPSFDDRVCLTNVQEDPSSPPNVLSEFRERGSGPSREPKKNRACLPPSLQNTSSERPFECLCCKCLSEEKQPTSPRNKSGQSNHAFFDRDYSDSGPDDHFVAQQGVSSSHRESGRESKVENSADVESLEALPSKASPRVSDSSSRRPRRSVTYDDETQSFDKRCSKPSCYSGSIFHERPSEPQTADEHSYYIPQPSQYVPFQHSSNNFLSPKTGDFYPLSKPRPEYYSNYSLPQSRYPHVDKVASEVLYVPRGVQTPDDAYSYRERQPRESLGPDSYSLTSGTSVDLDDSSVRKSVCTNDCVKPLPSNSSHPQDDPDRLYKDSSYDPPGWDLHGDHQAAIVRQPDSDRIPECIKECLPQCKKNCDLQHPPVGEDPSNSRFGRTSDNRSLAVTDADQSSDNPASFLGIAAHHEQVGDVVVNYDPEKALKSRLKPVLSGQSAWLELRRTHSDQGFRDAKVRDKQESSTDETKSQRSFRQNGVGSIYHSLADSSLALKQLSSFSLNDPYDALSATGLSRVSMKERCSSPALDPSYYLNRCLSKTRARPEKSYTSTPRSPASPNLLPNQQSIFKKQPSTSPGISFVNDQPDQVSKSSRMSTQNDRSDRVSLSSRTSTQDDRSDPVSPSSRSSLQNYQLNPPSPPLQMSGLDDEPKLSPSSDIYTKNDPENRLYSSPEKSSRNDQPVLKSPSRKTSALRSPSHTAKERQEKIKDSKVSLLTVLTEAVSKHRISFGSESQREAQKERPTRNIEPLPQQSKSRSPLPRAFWKLNVTFV